MEKSHGVVITFLIDKNDPFLINFNDLKSTCIKCNEYYERVRHVPNN